MSSRPIRPKQKRKFQHFESYLIRYDYQKPDGFWMMNQEICVEVPFSIHQDRDGDQHHIAEEEFRKRFKGKVSIVNIQYVD